MRKRKDKGLELWIRKKEIDRRNFKAAEKKRKSEVGAMAATKCNWNFDRRIRPTVKPR